MTMTERLLEATKEIWADYNEKPFVKGIADGSLDHKKFKYYMIQDYLYLLDYTKVFSLGTAKAADLSTMSLFSGYTHSILDGEMQIHRTYMKELGITKEELLQTPLALDNLSYTSYMLRIAYEGGAPEVMAAILSCALSYEWIAKKIVAEYPDADKFPHISGSVFQPGCARIHPFRQKPLFSAPTNPTHHGRRKYFRDNDTKYPLYGIAQGRYTIQAYQ